MMQYQEQPMQTMQPMQSYDMSNGMSGGFVAVADPPAAPMSNMVADPSDLGIAPNMSAPGGFDESDGGSSLMDAASGIESGQGGPIITDDAPSQTGGQVSAGQLMEAADENVGSVDDEVGANLDVGGMDILGDSFASGNGNEQNQQQQPQQPQQGNIRTPQPLDLSNPPPADDNLWSKITGFMGGGDDKNDKMASVKEAADQYKADQQNEAAQGVGLDKSMEYRGMSQQAEPQRGGRGGLNFRF